MLGVKPILGRPLTEDDDRVVGGGPVAVISYGLWRRAFGGSPSVPGRTIRVNDGTISGGTSGSSLSRSAAGAARPSRSSASRLRSSSAIRSA